MKTSAKKVPTETFVLLDDPTRRKILYLLGSKDLPVSKIADEIDLSPPTVYHHIKRLLTAGLVEVSKEERVGHLIESYYRPTAEIFTSDVGYFSVHRLIPNAEKALQGLTELGFKMDIDKNLTSKITALENKRADGVHIKELEEATSNLKNYDLATLIHVKWYATLLLMSDAQFDETIESIKEIRELLNLHCLDKPEVFVRTTGMTEQKVLSKHGR